MADVGIVQINLSYKTTNKADEFGNTQVKSAAFVKDLKAA